MTLGALIFTPQDKTVFSATESYVFEDLVLAVPNPSPYASIEKIFLPFTATIWILIMVAIMIAVVVIKTLQLINSALYELIVGDGNDYPFRNLVHIFIAGGALHTPRKNGQRILLITWIFACFIIRTVYQGKLFTFMTANILRDSVRNFDELVERDITIKSNHYYETFLHFDHRMETL